MTKKLATRTVQFPLLAECVLSNTDWVSDSVTLQKVTLGGTVALAEPTTVAGLISGKNTTITFDVVPLPPGAVLISGEVLVETPFVGSTATLSLGIAGALTAFVSAADITTTARVAFTVTTNVELTSNIVVANNVRATIALGNADFTAGKVRVRVMYTIDNKMHETVIT